MNHNDNLYLQHILDACKQIERYTSAINEGHFKQEPLYQDAIIRQLEIIGEAVKRLSDAVRQKHATIPWRYIAGMRDKLIHHYFQVDLDQVWLTAIGDIPVFRAQIEIIVQANTAL